MKISRELKTGIVVVVVIAAFIWSYNYMKDQNVFNVTDNIYYAKYDNVQGLNTASIVTINGFQVGKVRKIVFDSENRGSLIVSFSVNTDFEFSKNSITKIYSPSIMGGKAIAVVPSYEGERAMPGDYLVGEIESDLISSLGDKLNPIQAKLESFIVNADSLLVGLNDVLDYSSRQNLSETIKNLNVTMSNFASASNTLDEILADNEYKLDSTLSNIETMSGNFAAISDSLANANLAQTVASLETTINSFNSILSKLENGEGSMGKLLHDEGLYNNLEGVTKELEELLRDVKENPKRYTNFSIFEKKDKGYQPQTEEEIDK